MLTVWIGFDPAEAEAWHVAQTSLRNTGFEGPIMALDQDTLRARGVLTRRTGAGWDEPSRAPASTEFAISRFLVPILQPHGWALFVDCDVVFLQTPELMLREVSGEGCALYCVQHDYETSTQTKMGTHVQTRYERKNWSSVMLFDCCHRAHDRLTLDMVNGMRGLDLHRFRWLDDDQIGKLDPAWNWLVGEQPRPDAVHLAHFTLGGPWIDGWKGAEHDDLWHAARRQLDTRFP